MKLLQGINIVLVCLILLAPDYAQSAMTDAWVKKTNIASRYQHTATVFKDKIWVIGGHKKISWAESRGNRNIVGSSIFPPIQSTNDGITWNNSNPGLPFGNLLNHTTVVFKDKMWVLGGELQTMAYSKRDGADKQVFTSTNNIWSTEDGINWTKVQAIGPKWKRRTRHTSFVFKDKLWVIGGREADWFGRP